ncbi:hypothetical protein, partial [Flavobacterium sp.]
ATASGDQGAATASGDQGAAISLGINGKAKSIIGGWITVAEWKQDKNYDWQRIDIQTIKVDGEKIKPDTFYKLTEGQFVETE